MLPSVLVLTLEGPTNEQPCLKLTLVARLVLSIPAVVRAITDPGVEDTGRRVVALDELRQVGSVAKREVRTVRYARAVHLIRRVRAILSHITNI